MATRFYDYVIVGAGSAGSVLANRLTKNKESSVLLLEAGGQDVKPEIEVPLKCTQLPGSDIDWGYSSEPEQPIKGRTIVCPRGRVLGGSSSMNFMVYMRGNAHDYDYWEELGNPGWGYKDVLPYFKKSERQQRGEDDYHGVGGELCVSDVEHRLPISDLFIEAAKLSGHKYNNDFNGETQEGAGPIQLTTKDGKRHSTAAAFLYPILDRPNLTVETGALVTRVLLEGKCAVGVAYEVNGKPPTEARVRQEVILSAGSYNSPKLLMLSGIGDAEHLKELGIEVAVNLPGVGQNLRDHLHVPLPYESTQQLTPAATSNGIAESAVLLHSRSNQSVAPDLELMFGPVLWAPPGYSHSANGFSGIVALVRPESVGSVRLRSSNPADSPIITTNFLNCESDARKLVEGIRVMREMLHSNVLDEYRGKEVAPGADVSSDEALEEYVRETCGTVFHPVGTCRMGSDGLAVVDSNLRVRGVESLRVVDASVMPGLISGHTNAPAIMIGEKGADLITLAH